MVHYIIPEYLDPTKQTRQAGQDNGGDYMGYCSKHDKLVTCILYFIIGFGALVAIYTLITL